MTTSVYGKISTSSVQVDNVEYGLTDTFVWFRRPNEGTYQFLLPNIDRSILGIRDRLIAGELFGRDPDKAKQFLSDIEHCIKIAEDNIHGKANSKPNTRTSNTTKVADSNSAARRRVTRNLRY